FFLLHDQVIALLCGLLEFQFLGCRQHRFACLFNFGFQIFCRCIFLQWFCGHCIIVRFHVGSCFHGGGIFFVQSRGMISSYLLWYNTMCFVIQHLLFPSSICLVDGHLHTVGNLIGIEDYFSVHIPGCTSRCLCERTMRAQESFLIGVQHSHK